MIDFLKRHLDKLIVVCFCIILFAISLFTNLFVMIFNVNYYRIEEYEQEDLRMIMVCCIALSLILFIAFAYYKISNAKYKLFYAIAITTPLFHDIYILARTIPRFIDKSNYYETFDFDKWHDNKPLKMARKLCKDKSLIGISEDSLTTMLGWGRQLIGDTTSMKYETSAKHCYFVVKIQNNIVKDAYLYYNWKH